MGEMLLKTLFLVVLLPSCFHRAETTEQFIFTSNKGCWKEEISFSDRLKFLEMAEKGIYYTLDAYSVPNTCTFLNPGMRNTSINVNIIIGISLVHVLLKVSIS